MAWQLDQVASVRAIINVRKRARRSVEINIIFSLHTKLRDRFDGIAASSGPPYRCTEVTLSRDRINLAGDMDYRITHGLRIMF
jgi:hypothetical protein